MEKMEFLCEDCPEKVNQCNNDSPNLLVSIASEHDILGQERFSIPSKVESCREVFDAHENILSVEDNGKNVSIANSVSCDELLLKSDVNTFEILPDKGKQNEVINDVIDNVSSGGDKPVNSNLIGQSFKPLNISISHICNEETLSDQDSISVSSEETLDHDMVFHENDAAAVTFDGSDSLKTYAIEESVKSLRDDSEVLRDKFEECVMHKDDRQVYTDTKHSFSEIKDRVMSYLNKPSVSCESEIKEEECDKMLASNNTGTSKKSATGENNCLISVKEERALSFNSSYGINCSPIKSDTISFNSPMEVIAKWDHTEPSQNELISQHVLHDVAPEISCSNMIKFVQLPVSTDLTSLENNKVEEEMVEGNKSSAQHCIGNSNMELTNPDFEETACITDSVPSETLNCSSVKTSASEVCLGLVTNGDRKILDCSDSSSGTILFDCKEHVSLSGRDERKHLSSRTFPSLTSNSSNGSFINESFQPCYKSGTILTNSSLSSWGKLSFQPLTTSSINSPIFSSKSSNEEKLDSGLLMRSPHFEDSRSVTLKTFATLSQDDSQSRKTKSSEALFCTQILPQSYDSVVSGSITGKTSSTFSNMNFMRPSVLTKSSWPVNNLNKKPVFVVEKNSSNFTAIDSPIICNSLVGGISTCGPFKRFPENPFSKKPSESIGIFSSSQETSSIGFPTIFKPFASSATLSPKREKLSGKISAVSQDSMNITFSESKDTGIFSFNENTERQLDKQKNSSIFSFSNCDKSNDAKKFAFNPCQSRLEKKHVFCLQQPNEHPASQFCSTLAPFQFQNKSEKSKGSNSHRFTRMVRKPCKQYDKGISNLFEEANMLSTLQVDLPNTPFKPACGSDVMLDKGGDAKNVMVRYQNIVFMKEHLNVSPEELRVQYYHKTPVIGPFKFCASSEYSKSLSHKKIHNKEVQTDENLISKKYELTEIWRALECPVCLDVVMPPVYQCEQGHHACLTCWNKVVTCPLCKKRKSVTRNYMAEALIDQIPLPCKYHIEGCKETVCRTNKVSHEETCSYRMYQCPVPLCNQAHSYQNMCMHFKKTHKSLLHHEGHSVGKGEKFCDVLYKDHLSSSLIHAFDIAKWGLFFLREHSKHSRALFIQVMPASPEPAAYFYHLEVSDHHDCRKECYKGRVFSVGKPIKEIIDEEEYLSLSALIMKTVKKTAPLKIVVTIWQLKPAFTLSTD